jgi:hypothetical protein
MRFAPDDCIWVCAACGKTQTDKYGYGEGSSGWDESCMLNAILCKRNNIIPAERVTKTDPYEGME